LVSLQPANKKNGLTPKTNIKKCLCALLIIILKVNMVTVKNDH
jgi:hypothetical protein